MKEIIFANLPGNIIIYNYIILVMNTRNILFTVDINERIIIYF